MDRITGQTTIDIGGGRRGFRGRNAAAGQSGTVVKADWLNPMQEEIMAVIEAAGLAPDENDWTQLYQAIQIVSVMKSGFVPVLGFAADEPAGAPLGATYVVSANPNGAFVGKAHQIAIRFSTRWVFLPAQHHTIAVNTAAGVYWRRTADGWEIWAAGENGSGPIQFATAEETIAGQISDKAPHPKGVAVAVQGGTWNTTTASGTANALTVTLSPAPMALPSLLVVKFTASNTAAATIKVNGFDPVSILRFGGDALEQNDLQKGGTGLLALDANGNYQVQFQTLKMLTAAVNFYVDGSTGNDTNDGLAPGAGHAFATIQGAINAIIARYLSTGNVTINVANGTYAGFKIPSSFISGWNIIGNPASPGSVIIQSLTAEVNLGLAVTTSTGTRTTLNGFTLKSLYSNIGGLGDRELININFNAPTSGVMVIGAYGSSSVEIWGTCSLTGNAHSFLNASVNGTASLGYIADIAANNKPLTLTFIGTPNLTYGVVVVAQGAQVTIFSSVVALVGGATGGRYNVQSFGVINTNGAGPNYLPGSTAGGGDGYGLYK